MIIRLEHRGSVVREARDSDLPAEVVIGRSRTCTWALPPTDEVASSRHASLIRHGGRTSIRDLGSKNGLYCQGAKITEKKLSPGDRITIGDSLLVVEEEKEAAGGRRPSTLTIQSGPAKGRRIELVPPRLTIGSDPGCGLAFLDMLVSKKHAEIVVKDDGSCWARDLGSKNGTSVNGLPLHGDQERLLKDGDRIQVAHIDLRFLDGAVKHVNYQTGLRIAVLVGTLLLAWGAYSVFQTLRPSARYYLDTARREAAAGRFEPARALVAKAAGARRAERHEIERTDLARLIGVWNITVVLWDKAQKELAAKDWVAASRDLGTLLAGGKDAWGWNPQASQLRQEAALSKLLLDALARAEQTRTREDSSLADYQRARDAVRDGLGRLATIRPPACLGPLTESLRQNQAALDRLLAENRALDETLARLNTMEPPFPEILRTLQAQGREPGPLLRRRLDAVTPVVQALANGYAGIQQVAAACRNLKFDEASKIKVVIPPPADCAVDAMASRCRSNLEKLHGMVRRTGSQLGFLMGLGEKSVNQPELWQESINFFADPEVLERVLTCDVLSGPLPKRARTEPSGAYDTGLGIEEFYAFLGNLPSAPEPPDGMPFTPKLRRLRELGLRAERVLTYLNEPDCRWLLTGAVVETRDRLQRALAARDLVVKSCAEQAVSRQGRSALVAAGIAAYLAPTAKGPDDRAATWADWTTLRFKDYRGRIAKLSHDFEAAQPQQQILLRGAILDTGLPGDQLVRRMWAMRDAGTRPAAAP
ncbi:MAG: FHA domain-containing protein [Lentisphaeria bacterium]